MVGRAAPSIALAALVVVLTAAAPAAAAPDWLAPADLSAPGRNASEPDVAVDAAGNSVAVWARLNGAHTIIQASSRPAGGSWTQAVDLSAAGRPATEPQVAVNAGGRAVAIWSRSDGAHTVIQGASRPAGGGWSAALDISDSERNASEPEVAVDAGGRAVAIWSRFDGSDDIAQSAVLPPAPGSGWSGADDLSEDGEDAEEPQVAVDGSGNAIAVWTRLKGASMTVQAAFDAGGGGNWQAVDDLSAAAGNATEPQLAVDASGVVVVWSRAVGAFATVQAAEAAVGGEWGEPVDLSVTDREATEPHVALGGGRAVAVWSLGDAGPYSSIQGRERPPGSSWLPTQDLTQPGLTQTVIGPRVALDPGGNAAAVWARSGASPTVIDGRTKRAGAPWSGIDELSELGNSSVEPRIALGATGDGATVWSRDNGANTIVQAAGFDSAGPSFPSLSIPAAATVRQPVGFAAATFDNWSPVRTISWTFGDGGDGAIGAQVEHSFGNPGTYPISIVAADAIGNAAATSGSITVYRLPNAARNARLRRRSVRVMVTCPSPAGCTGTLRLIARVVLTRNGRSFGKRAQIGKAHFSVPGPGTTAVPVRLSRAGLNAIKEAGSKGVKTQLTGPGIQHRLLLLLPQRR